jgi:hypothetical protein
VPLVLAELAAGRDVKVSPPEAAGKVGVKVEGRTVPGQRRGAAYVAGVVHRRTKVDPAGATWVMKVPQLPFSLRGNTVGSGMYSLAR